MADVTFEMEGAEALEAKLKGISYDMRFKGGRFALRKAANLVRDKAKESAQRFDDPKTAEVIANNLAVRWSGKHFKRTDDLKFRVGVRGGAKGYAAASGELKGKGKGNPGGDTFYWRFLEFGTANMPAQPFMRPAIAESTQAATQEFIKQYGKAVDRAIKRAERASGGK